MHCFTGVVDLDIHILHFFAGILFWCVPSSFVSIFVLIDLTPRRCFLICPCWVLSESGKCFLTVVVVSPGHVTKFPYLIASIHVSLTGNLAAAWRYLIDCWIEGRL
jgi:hypothetical protein